MSTAGWLLGACHGDSSSDDDEANEPCEYVEDGECDEPEGTDLCGEGTDRVDCAGGGGAFCEFRNDGICDEPEGTGDCDEGTDRVDCTRAPQLCQFVNNGRCDEPEGTALCEEGTDTSDCSGQSGPCPFQNDGFCDEPEGTGDCDEGTDPSDCLGSTASCPFTFDGTCNEPEGQNNCPEGTDSFDCMRFGDCPFTNDGLCDEPEGTGDCAEGTDPTDCTRLACGATACEPILLPGIDPLPGTTLTLSCCVTEGTCGINVNGRCEELNEPLPGDCPSYPFPVLGGQDIVGCCLPTGMCGAIFRTTSADYCAEIASDGVLAPFLPTTPVACGGVGEDGGVE